jgi:long-chain acyl-CoA synthetase
MIGRADCKFLEFTFYLLGVQIGYATVKTLLDDNVRNCRGDFAAYKPVRLFHQSNLTALC